jgi:hypothetical protein
MILALVGYLSCRSLKCAFNRRVLAARSFGMVNGGTTPRNATLRRLVWLE